VRSNRASLVASLLIGAALLVLAVSTASGILALLGANHRVEVARAVVTPYLTLQRAVAGEASAEAGYRRAPGVAARMRLETAVVTVSDAVEAVRAETDGQDRATLSRLERLNERYVREVRATLDVADSERTDDHVAGPALDAMQDLLDDAISGHRLDGKAAVDHQEIVIDRLAVAFLLAFAVLGWTWRTILLDHRRLRVEAARHEERALTDVLTGLPNREALRLAVDLALARARTRAALLFLDLDRFKPVNDTFGHHVGDLVLREVARRLQSTLRAGEIAARLGGDEFAVFLPRGLEAPAVAERILRAIEEPFLVEGHEVRIGTSIGIARCPEDGGDHDALLRVADLALYDAKQAGRGRVAEPAGV
jgi:diguanylate cyclase (GGDEF)-like protein